MKEQRSDKVQGYVPSYAKFVVKGLIGILGTNESDVVSFMIRDWISKNQDQLARSNLLIEDWRRSVSGEKGP